LAFKEESAAYN